MKISLSSLNLFCKILYFFFFRVEVIYLYINMYTCTMFGRIYAGKKYLGKEGSFNKWTMCESLKMQWNCWINPNLWWLFFLYLMCCCPLKKSRKMQNLSGNSSRSYHILAILILIIYTFHFNLQLVGVSNICVLHVHFCLSWFKVTWTNTNYQHFARELSRL